VESASNFNKALVTVAQVVVSVMVLMTVRDQLPLPLGLEVPALVLIFNVAAAIEHPVDLATNLPMQHPAADLAPNLPMQHPAAAAVRALTIKTELANVEQTAASPTRITLMDSMLKQQLLLPKSGLPSLFLVSAINGSEDSAIAEAPVVSVMAILMLSKYRRLDQEESVINSERATVPVQTASFHMMMLVLDFLVVLLVAAVVVVAANVLPLNVVIVLAEQLVASRTKAERSFPVFVC